MVRGTTRAIVGAAAVATAAARTALAATPMAGRGEAATQADADVETDVEAASAEGTVTPLIPEQGDAPDGADPSDPAPGTSDDPDFDPAAVAARELATREGEDPWTEAEVAEVHEELTRRAAELRGELSALDAELDGLIRRGGEGTGQDSADVGSASSERDQEISLGNNARSMLAQTERALARLTEGSFGVCEGCGGAIGKMRVMAFPRATLCLSCKQREERR